MAEETGVEQDVILEDIESSLQTAVEPGYTMTIHPDGTIQIATGKMRISPPFQLGNPHYSCCCSDG